MGEKLSEWLLSWLEPYYTLHALLAWLVVLVLIFSAVNPFLQIFFDIQWLFYFYAIVVVSFTASWLWGRFRLPRGHKAKLNVVIAISTECEPASELLKRDLLKQLNRNLNSAEFSNITHVVDFPNHFAERVGPAVIQKWNKKVKAQMWVWGCARSRNGLVFLDLEGWVMHTPIPITASKNLAADFRAALPKRIQFLQDISFQGSEITANLIYYTALYITGVAALISGDPTWALRTHSRLQEELEALPEIPSNLEGIARKIPQAMSDAHIVKGIVKLNQDDYEGARSELNAAFALRRINYSGLILKSVIKFIADKDPAGALVATDEAEQCAGSDATWIYNRVFLLLYTRDYPEALRLLRTLERHDRKNDIPISNEAIEFTERYIAADQEHAGELFFWLGFLYYKKIDNLPAALKYLEKFVEITNNHDMQILNEVAEEWLDQILTAMQIGKHSASIKK